jgi:chemotaxis protein CheX
MTERFILPDRLDTSGAAGLVDRLLGLRGAPLTIDASGVEVIGARALEVLIATGQQWAADGVLLRIDGVSDCYAAACETLGLRPEAPWLAVDQNVGLAV